jgi:hypothetical protein
MPTLNSGSDESQYQYLMIRSFNPSTWALSDIIQFRVSKQAMASNMAKYICLNLFPDIQQETMFCCKYDYGQQFKRGDLALKSWNKLDL